MIKKLDKLIIKSFIGPFIITFFIAFFVLMMQILWKYIDDLVGKGLDFIVIAQFLWYASASLLTLAMPIAILISSIMTFGNLGESFELVAIKSAGISLLRFMRPLVLVAIMLSGVTFLFANYVIPFATLKFKALYQDIYVKKPAFNLKEGVFFTYIPHYAIKVGKKESDGKTIRNVLIYEDNNNNLQDNCIIAEKGIMKISDDNMFLEFNLENGFRYQERGNVYDTATEFVRFGFTNFKKLFDLSVLQKQETPDSAFKGNYQMLSARQLNKNIDSLIRVKDSMSKRINPLLTSYLRFTNQPDSNWNKAKKDPLPATKTLFTDSISGLILSSSINLATELKTSLQFGSADVESKEKDIRFHRIEWHRKFSLSLACLVLFFIGAPLGSIIRKGGIGMPLVVAIIFFLIFHLLNMFGEKFVKESIVTPSTGMWLAVMVLIPVGIFLTYKAMHDSQLFNKEYYYRAYVRIRSLFRKFKEGDKVKI